MRLKCVRSLLERSLHFQPLLAVMTIMPIFFIYAS